MSFGLSRKEGKLAEQKVVHHPWCIFHKVILNKGILRTNQVVEAPIVAQLESEGTQASTEG